MMCSIFFLSGCATFSGSINPRVKADMIATHNGFQKFSITTRDFSLFSYIKINEQGKPLTLYIEGDGHAWLTRSRLSEDPTPANLITLTLASMDQSSNVAYLARPGQYWDYTKGPICSSEYWSNKRFSESVIASMNEAVDQLKKRAEAGQIHLVGYSGGAAIAVLVAARRRDIASLRTIAGNLDHEAVTRFQAVSPLTGSLNPIDYAGQIASIPQVHYIGGKDSVIPESVSQNYAKKANNPSCIKIINVPQASQISGWIDFWPAFLDQPPVCRKAGPAERD